MIEINYGTHVRTITMMTSYVTRVTNTTTPTTIPITAPVDSPDDSPSPVPLDMVSQTVYNSRYLNYLDPSTQILLKLASGTEIMSSVAIYFFCGY